MPEQITPLSILYLLLHGAGTAICVVLCLYLLLCRGKAVAPDITPPARLRRWAAALFGVMAMAHIWWILFYTFSNDTHSVLYGLLVAIDCMALPPVFVGTLLAMLQDRPRPLWPIFVVMTPCAVLAVLQTALPSIDLTTPNKIYGLALVVTFIIYMVVAVRQYGRWLRDNYADLEHKEVWISLTLLIGLMLLLTSYEYTDDYVMCTIAHLTGFPLAALLLWRVETLKDLSTDNLLPHSAHSDRYYLSQYFTSQNTSYYEYIHDLRVAHFVARYHELAAAQEPIVAHQLARESGYHSYSTFSAAFKQRMHQSVTAWMHMQPYAAH